MIHSRITELAREVRAANPARDPHLLAEWVVQIIGASSYPRRQHIRRIALRAITQATQANEPGRLWIVLEHYPCSPSVERFKSPSLDAAQDVAADLRAAVRCYAAEDRPFFTVQSYEEANNGQN